MSDDRKDLPPANSPNFQEKAREAIQTYLGNRGDLLDRGLTVRDLADAGLIEVNPAYFRNAGRSPPVGGPGPALEDTYEPDLTPPPMPTGFSVTAAISNLLISHDAPVYLQGHGHARTVVYGATWTSGPVPVFANAVPITEFTGTVASHATNPATTWHLWIKWQSVDGVLSTVPAGGTNGVVVTTGQNVELLLLALNSQITTSQLHADLSATIGLINADDTVAGSVAQRLLAEANARIAAVQAEAAARTQALLDEADARVAALNAEALNRTAAIAAESVARSLEVNAEVTNRVAALAAEAIARGDAIAIETSARNAALAAETQARAADLLAEAAARGAAITAEATTRQTADDSMAGQITTLTASVGTNAAAISTETTARSNADNAFAGQLTTLGATVDGNTAAITAETTARADADTAISGTISTLTTQVNTNTADIITEASARATAISAEATTREALATQFRGSYTGNDVAALTSGLLYQERTARSTEDEALSQQITLLSAGAGEQFDYKNIWYFDTGVESWTGNGTPTATAGWIKPADHATDPYVDSPAGIAVDGSKYSQVRIRIRKTGTPVWGGYLWWRAVGDATWDAARRVALTEPTYDGNGIGLVLVSPAWAVTVDRIRIDLSDDQSASHYMEMDWAAIGRPSPGASSAQLLDEQSARAAADSAEVTARQTLSSKLLGTTDPNSVTLATLASGIVFDERSTRTSADTALSSSISSLTATVNTNLTNTNASITSEATARANADTAISSSVTALTTRTTAAEGAITTEQTTRANADTAINSSITALTTRTTSAEAAIVTEQNTRSSADAAEVTARQALSTAFIGANDPTGKTLTNITSGLLFDERTARSTADSAEIASRQTLATSLIGAADPTGKTLANITSGIIFDERTARSTADASEVTARQSLATKMTGVADPSALTLATLSTGLLFDERTARSTAISSEVTSRETLAAQLRGSYTGSDVNLLVGGLLYTERVARATADSALTSQFTELSATVDDTQAALTTEETTRATQDTALAGQITTLTATVSGNDTAQSAALQNEANLRVGGDAAEASARTTLAARVTATEGNISINAANIVTEQNTRASADSALSSRATALESSVNSGTTGLATKASVAYVDQAEADAISSAAIATAQVNARLNSGGDTYNSIVNVTNTASTKSANFVQSTAPTATRTNDLWVDTANSNILKRWNGTSWVTADDQRIGSTASSVTTLQSQMTGATGSELLSSITTESTTRATQTGELYAKYTVKLDVNGYVSGFGLASTLNNATPYSQFIFKADQFAFGAPGLATAYPFVIQASATTINGVAVPAGVYMDAAYIKNGTITNVKIGDAAIDDAKIANLSAAKLTIGDGTVGGNLKSGSYVAGSSGWILRPDGYAELSNVVIRGAVYATSGYMRGLDIQNSAGAVILSSGNTLQDQIAPYASGATVGATFGVDIGGQITPNNVSTFIANAAINSAQIGSISLVGIGKFSVKTASVGQRIEMDSRVIKVYDSSGMLRVQIGDLSA